MKKIYLFAISLMFASSLVAQVALNSNPTAPKLTRDGLAPMTSFRTYDEQFQIGMRDVILTENFETVTGPFPAVLPLTWTTTVVSKTNGTTTNTADDFFGPAFDIQTATTANLGGYWPVVESGVNNKFAGANDDAAPCDCVMDAIYLQTPTISFAAAQYPAITFSIYNDGNFGGGDGTISISIDGGTTYNLVPFPDDVDGFLPLEEGAWQVIVLTLFDYAGENEVSIRFNWSDAGSWASGFAVDNVVIGDLEENSLTLNKVVMGDWNQADFGLGFWDYSRIPVSQSSPVKATAIANNTGFNNLTNVAVNVEIMQGATSMGTWAGTTNPELVSLTRDTMSVVTDFTPTAVGTYSITATLSSDSTETDLLDNVATTSFLMTDCTYARDLNGAQAFMAMAAGEVAGNLFDIYNTEAFSSIKFAIGAGSNVGATLTGVIFEFGGFDAAGAGIFTFVESSGEVDIYAEALNAVNGSNFTCLPFSPAVTLEGGKTYLVSVFSSEDLRVPVSGSNVWVSSWRNVGNTFAAIGGIPMVRLVGACADACTVGVQEEAKDNSSLNQNIPNPASISTRIGYTLSGSSKVVLSIRDITGQLVDQFELGNKSIGKHNFDLNVEAYAPGLYTYTINAGGSNITRKMIVD